MLLAVLLRRSLRLVQRQCALCSAGALVVRRSLLLLLLLLLLRHGRR